MYTHIPTGISARVDGRDKHKNEREALRVLTERVNHYYKTGEMLEQIKERRGQIGNGTRSDKRRTYRVKNNQVVDHITGKTAKLKHILRGKIELLK